MCGALVTTGAQRKVGWRARNKASYESADAGSAFFLVFLPRNTLA